MVKIGLASALGAIFAALVIVAVFMPWVETVTAVFNITTDYSGWQIFNKDGDIFDVKDFAYYYLPIVVAALGVLSLLIFLAAPKGNVTALVLVLFGLAIIAVAYMTYSQFNAYIEESVILNAMYDVKMMWGLFLAMGAGAGTIICGALARE